MAKKPKLNDYKTQRQNANAHTARGLGMLANSISQDGWIGGMTVAADGETFDGSARLETLADAMPDAEPIVVHTDGTRPVIVVRDDIPNTDDPRAKRLGIAANRIAQVDYAVDAAVLAELAGEVDLSQFWNTDELAEILGEAAGNDAADPGVDVDRAAELQEKWQTEVGQLWQIGRHRLLVGDCTVRENVERLMGGERAALMVTSPPYFVGKDYEKDQSWLGFCELIRSFPDVGKDALLPDAFAFVNFGEVYNHPILSWQMTWQAFTDCGYRFFDFRVWHRPSNNPIYTATQPRSNNEVEFLHTYVIGKPKMTVRDFSISHKCLWATGQPEALGHAAAFSVDLPINAITIYTDADDVVYEPFNGSGTTLVACERMGRIGRGIELSPAYAAVTLERLTGLGLDAHKVDDA